MNQPELVSHQRRGGRLTLTHSPLTSCLGYLLIEVGIKTQIIERGRLRGLPTTGPPTCHSTGQRAAKRAHHQGNEDREHRPHTPKRRAMRRLSMLDSSSTLRATSSIPAAD